MLCLGNQNEIEVNFNEASRGLMKVKGSQQGDISAKLGFGAEWELNEMFNVYANAGYSAADNYENMYANIGLRFKILR